MRMICHGYCVRVMTLCLLLGLACSCAEAPVVKSPQGPFWVATEITFLMDSPGYDGNVLSPLYKGDKVDRMDEGDSAWWRVKLQRSGQAGWVRKELLSPESVGTVFYFVNEDTLPLQECPRSDCLPLLLLYRGEQVQKVKEGDHGWWRVLVAKSRSFGWVRASTLTEHIEDTLQKQVRRVYYYVAVRKLILRAQPSKGGEVIRTLRFNDQVQKIGETKDWFKVRQPASGALGWVPSRDLDTLPLKSPRGMPAKKEVKPFKQKEEPLVEPEFM